MLLFSRWQKKVVAGFTTVLICCQFRNAWAFAPRLGAVRQWRLGSSPMEGPGMSGKDAAGKALEQAAKLRQEIAELEQDLSKGTHTDVVKKVASCDGCHSQLCVLEQRKCVFVLSSH